MGSGIKKALTDLHQQQGEFKESFEAMRGQYNNTCLLCFRDYKHLDLSMQNVCRIVAQLRDIMYNNIVNAFDLLFNDSEEAGQELARLTAGIIKPEYLVVLKQLIQLGYKINKELHANIPSQTAKAIKEEAKNKITYTFNYPLNNAEEFLLLMEQIKRANKENCAVENKLFIQDIFQFCARVADGN